MYRERYDSMFSRVLDKMHGYDDNNKFELWDLTHNAFVEAITEHSKLEETINKQTKKLQEFESMSLIDFARYKFRQIKLPRLSITWE